MLETVAAPSDIRDVDRPLRGAPAFRPRCPPDSGQRAPGDGWILWSCRRRILPEEITELKFKHLLSDGGQSRQRGREGLCQAGMVHVRPDQRKVVRVVFSKGTVDAALCRPEVS